MAISVSHTSDSFRLINLPFYYVGVLDKVLEKYVGKEKIIP